MEAFLSTIHKLSMLVFLLALPACATFVAVLETISATNVVTREEKMYLTDVLRSEAIKALPAEQNYTIMTRENINVMLPPGMTIEECEGICLVETGKNISADYVAQGRIGRFANDLTITVELYETAGNKLVGGFSTKALNIESLEAEIRQKSQDMFSKIIASTYGKLDLQPTYADSVGRDVDLVIKIDDETSLDGRKFTRGLWELPPGQHSIEFLHRCYEPQQFKVNVLSGKTTEVTSVLETSKGNLLLDAEFNGLHREVPVYLNGITVGKTPFQGLVPICAQLEVGEDVFREAVIMDWADKDSLKIVFQLKNAKPTLDELHEDSLRLAEQKAADDAARKAKETTKRSKVTKPISIALMALGVASVGIGIYENAVMNDERKKYDRAAFNDKKDFDDQWDKIESSHTKRNVFYGVGLGLIGAGSIIFFVF